MTRPPSLINLISRARCGDREAFDTLVSTSGERLASLVAARLRPEIRSQLSVEELVQEIFARAFEAMGKFEGEDEDAWFAWLSGIAKNVVLQAISKLQRGSRSLLLEPEPPDAAPSPSRVIRREERFDRLSDAMRDLPDDYRKAIQLCRIDGLKIREAAERMNRLNETSTTTWLELTVCSATTRPRSRLLAEHLPSTSRSSPLLILY